MQILVSVDAQSRWEPAARLLNRLSFKDASVQLLHIVESVLPDGSFPDLPQDSPVAMIMAERVRQGKEALADATKRLEGRYRIAGETVDFGAPVEITIDRGRALGADLTAVGSTQQGFWSSLFFGSMSKGLAVGAHSSVLFGKGEPPSDGAVTAIFATDHSDYSMRCLDRFLAMSPTGLAKVVVVTANVIEPELAELMVQDVPELGDEVKGWFSEKLLQRTRAVADRFRTLGCEVEAEVIEKKPFDALSEAMSRHGADLLVIGAQGHGFLERTRLGSVSFDQVVGTAHSVLIVRV